MSPIRRVGLAVLLAVGLAGCQQQSEDWLGDESLPVIGIAADSRFAQTDARTPNERIVDRAAGPAFKQAPEPSPNDEALSVLAGERFSGDHSPAPLFNPPPRAAPAAAPQSILTAAPPAGPGPLSAVPPMEWFNYRAPWPAASGGVSLGETTFYLERYHDRQWSTTAGRGHIHNTLRRDFYFHRYGVIVK